MNIHILPFFVTLSFGFLLLSGCSGPAFLAGTAYTVYTDRLPSDDLASFVTGRDCNTIRAEREKTAICRDPSQTQKRLVHNTPPVWCYRSIASASCYSAPLQDETAELIR